MSLQLAQQTPWILLDEYFGIAPDGFKVCHFKLEDVVKPFIMFKLEVQESSGVWAAGDYIDVSMAPAGASYYYEELAQNMTTCRLYVPPFTAALQYLIGVRDQHGRRLAMVPDIESVGTRVLIRNKCSANISSANSSLHYALYSFNDEG